MTPIKAWEGAGTTLHRSPLNAATSIIKNAAELELKEAIGDNHPPHEKHQALRSAILWAADHIRSELKKKANGEPRKGLKK